MAMRSDGNRVQEHPLSQTRGQDEIEKGKVDEVVQRFQVHEDTAFAYKIQSAEYKNHVSRNKEQRKSVRDNIKTAKETYLEEVKNAGILPENSVAEIEQKQWLAEELHKRIEREEHLARTQMEKQRQNDEEIAQQLQRDEQKRLRYLEHKRQQRIAKDEEEHRRLQILMKQLEEADIGCPDDDVIRGNDVVMLPENKDIVVEGGGIMQEHLARTQMEKQRQKDEEIAHQLQRDEEKRLRYLEHKRQQRIAKDEEEHRRLQILMKQLEQADIGDPHDDVIRGDDVVVLPENKDIIVVEGGVVIDARHNEIQTEEQRRQNLKQRDEELAKILQEQEDHQIEKKRTIQEDYRKAIELQDREIAKHLQRQEKAYLRAERQREKQIRRGQSLPERDELTSGQRRNRPTYHDAVDDFRREDVPPVRNDSPRVDTRRQSEPERGEQPSQVRAKREGDYEQLWNSRSGAKTHAVTTRMLDSNGSQEPGGYYNNVAETLDPTFQRTSPCPSAEECVGPEEGERSSGGKSALIVPALRRKTSKEKGKKIKGKK